MRPGRTAGEVFDAHARVIEAYAEPAFDRNAPIRISPLDARQAKDPQFRKLAGELYDRLTEQGFKVVTPDTPFDVEYLDGESNFGEIQKSDFVNLLMLIGTIQLLVAHLPPRPEVKSTYVPLSEH